MNFLCVIPSLGPIWMPAYQSVLRQVYPKSKVFVIVIEDNAGKEQISAIDGNWQHIVWKREQRNYAAKNIYDAISKVSMFGIDVGDIVVHIDGDDLGLCKPSVFQQLEKIYKDRNVWITYGSYVTPKDSSIIVGRSYKDGVNIRVEKWRASHLRTYRLGLVEKLTEVNYKDKNGKWLKTAIDLAMMFPMIEMAGLERSFFISSPMYFYNNRSEINDYRISAEDQKNNEIWLRSLNPYKRLDKLSDSHMFIKRNDLKNEGKRVKPYKRMGECI